MAIIFNCAQDWTYDKYVEDIKLYGSDFEDSSNYTGYFMGFMKRSVERFLTKWNAAHDGKLYAKGYGYAGDAFVNSLGDWFSDFYKDAYGQRPHLPMWFYIHPLGLPMQEDTARMFCASPVEDAEENAKAVRAAFEREEGIA